jgi:polar amino acid transport system permease protein
MMLATIDEKRAEIEFAEIETRGRAVSGSWSAAAAVPASARPETGRGRIEIRGVHKHYGAFHVLRDVNLDIEAGKVTSIIGPSGSGKTTLLRSINHLEKVDSGYIAIDNELIGYRRKGERLYELKEKEILERRTSVAMVFQGFYLFPHMTALENVIEAPVSVKRISKAEAIAEARALLSRVGLADKEDSYPNQLSGGQQQRVAIARALAMKPKVILFDEPTSALDPELVGEVLQVIGDLSRSGTTLVIVTHELGFAREVSDKVVFFDEGRALEFGTPSQIFSSPRCARTVEFISKLL